MDHSPAPLNPYAPPTAPVEVPAGHVPAGPYFFRSLWPLANAVTIAMVCHVLIEVVAIANLAGTINAMNRILAGEEVSEESLGAIDERSGLIAIVELVILAAAGVAFCMLMVRSNRNARSFARMPMEFTPGWSAGWFFVPFANLWKPYQAFREIWRASDSEPDVRVDLRYTDVPLLLPIWWLTFMVDCILNQIAFRMETRVKGADDLLLQSKVAMAATVTSLVAGMLALVVVRRLAARQQARHALPGTPA